MLGLDDRLLIFHLVLAINSAVQGNVMIQKLSIRLMGMHECLFNVVLCYMNLNQYCCFSRYFMLNLLLRERNPHTLTTFVTYNKNIIKFTTGESFDGFQSQVLHIYRLKENAAMSYKAKQVQTFVLSSTMQTPNAFDHQMISYLG
ncbi:CLUMA_CG013049, isoform A [Clunio marinus]|uniref:CLUMA_CG013049, isoform A n=1 Tax=Clunio marinus TaxID=568069 RepID=A0A1J1IHJ2_9DIPT|nr:CLUMA_CG013049, isoform A [Clunio marinus]